MAVDVVASYSFKSSKSLALYSELSSGFFIFFLIFSYRNDECIELESESDLEKCEELFSFCF